MKNDMKKRILSAHLALILLLMLWCGTYFETKESQRQMEQLKASQSESGASNAVKVKRKLMYKAMHTPLGKYPETVTYTLGKIAGANNSNLPVGDTYENNAYTRYLKKSFNRFLIISLDVLICRYSPLFRAFPALFISEEPHKSFYYPSCFRSQK